MTRSLRKDGTILLLSLVAAAAFLAFLYGYDNKYTHALPASKGICVWTEDDTGPSFLIDEWEYYPGQLLTPDDFVFSQHKRSYIYLGEEPNFSKELDSPFGTATYRIRLQSRNSAVLSLYVPEVLCASKVFINKEEAGSTGSVSPYQPLIRDQVYPLPLDGEAEIIIQTANYSHYYGGLYYPPAVGSAQEISSMLAQRMMLYGLFCFGPMAIALSNLALWAAGRARKNRMALYFGVLCTAFAVQVCYPFLHMAQGTAVRLQYLLENTAGGLVLLCTAVLTVHAASLQARPLYRRVLLPVMVFFHLVYVLFSSFILPYTPVFINAFGLMVSVWKLLSAVCLIAVSIYGYRKNRSGKLYLLTASVLFAVFQLFSVLTINRFEPIRGGWPEEYASLLFGVLFAAMMARRSRDIMEENEALNEHLQQEVARQTEALSSLLRDRKRFLADLVHDLKTPLTAVRNYTELIRLNGVGLDQETEEYLNAMSDKMDALNERFGILREFTATEREGFHPQDLCLNKLLAEFHRQNKPDLEVNGQHFLLSLPRTPLNVCADPDQLWRVLENLCYNALSFTPSNGDIRISLHLEPDGRRACIQVSDSGEGIPAQDLPHIFERNYSSRAGEDNSGLGLFIARRIVLEHGGTITTESEEGGGSVFTILLPLS